MNRGRSVAGARIRFDWCACACCLGESVQIFPAPGANVEGIGVLSDDGKETELGAEPHKSDTFLRITTLAAIILGNQITQRGSR